MPNIMSTIRGHYHHFLQVAVGCKNKSNIDGDFIGASYRRNFFFLNYSKDLTLKIKGEIGYFIDEKSTSLRCFEKAFFILSGAGKTACPMSEQFGFKKVGVERRAIYFYHA